MTSYLECTSTEKWIESSYDSEGPLYWITMSILVHSAEKWSINRLSHLRRLIVLAHARNCSPTSPLKNFSDKTVKDYSVYKPYLNFFGLIDGIYNNFFKVCTILNWLDRKKLCSCCLYFQNISGNDEQWPSNVADYIRHNDETLLKASERLLSTYTEELLPCTTFPEFCDVAGKEKYITYYVYVSRSLILISCIHSDFVLITVSFTGLLEIITNPETYIGDLLKGV